jgi:hypothetical protein
MPLVQIHNIVHRYTAGGERDAGDRVRQLRGPRSARLSCVEQAQAAAENMMQFFREVQIV